MITFRLSNSKIPHESFHLHLRTERNFLINFSKFQLVKFRASFEFAEALTKTNLEMKLCDP